MRNRFFLLALFMLTIPVARAQKLFRAQLSDADKKDGVIAKYEYHATDAYGYIGLWLYTNNKYEYTLETFARKVFSEGKWYRKKDKIVLESKIKPHDLPVKLVYINNDSMSRDPGNDFILRIVEDPHGKLLRNAFVYVNSDSIQCLPEIASCLGSFSKIDSVRVAIEYGPSSKWIKVLKQDFKQLLLVVEVDVDLTRFDAFDRREYRVIKSGLELIQ